MTALKKAKRQGAKDAKENRIEEILDALRGLAVKTSVFSAESQMTALKKAKRQGAKDAKENRIEEILDALRSLAVKISVFQQSHR